MKHIDLLNKEISFSPTEDMDEFTVYKDITLSLRKMYNGSFYNGEGNPPNNSTTVDDNDREALEILNSLLELKSSLKEKPICL